MNNSTEIVVDTFLSAILKKDCFRITGDISSTPLLKKNVFYTYTFTFDPWIMSLCNEKGFVYLGGRVDFVLQKRDSGESKDASEYEIVNNTGDLDFENVYAISDAIAKKSRFYLDNHTKNYAQTIYQEWVKNSLQNGYADDFFLIKKAEKSIGLITLKREEKGMRIDLIGVSEKYQGKGIGTLLINLVKNKYKGEEIYVGAQAENVTALNFYFKNGFVATSYKMIYRKYS